MFGVAFLIYFTPVKMTVCDSHAACQSDGVNPAIQKHDGGSFPGLTALRLRTSFVMLLMTLNTL
jgi:hypothetical protein